MDASQLMQCSITEKHSKYLPQIQVNVLNSSESGN